MITIDTSMLAFIITNLTNGTLPWNTTASPNPLYLPKLITQNFPWFFPLITLVFMLAGDYVLGIKRQADSKVQFIAVAIVFTMLQYIEVAGGLASSAYFFIFEFIMMISMFFMILFGGNLYGN